MNKENYCIKMKTTDELILCVEFDKLNPDELTACVEFDKLNPIFQIRGQGQISCYNYSWINISVFGCKCESNKIIEKYNILVNDGWRLNCIADKLIKADLKCSIKTAEYQTGLPENFKDRRPLPLWHNLIKLIDLYCQIEKSDVYYKIDKVQFDSRTRSIKKQLNRSLGNDIELFQTIIQIISELTFISNLSKSSTISWNKLHVPPPKGGADFPLDIPFVNKPIIIEMTTRTKEFESLEEPYDILEISIPAFLVYFAYSSKKDYAFFKQKADILFVDLSHSYAGLLFRHANLKTKDLSFDSQFNKAIELAKNNKKSVILFMELYMPYKTIFQTMNEEMFNLTLNMVKEREKKLIDEKRNQGLRPPTTIEILKEINRYIKDELLEQRK